MRRLYVLEQGEVTTLLYPPGVDVGRWELIAGLRQLRESFAEAAEGKSLLEIEANVGLVFWDLCEGFALTPRERIDALGDPLYEQLKSFVEG
jgi:hypothetical protein